MEDNITLVIFYYINKFLLETSTRNIRNVTSIFLVYLNMRYFSFVDRPEKIKCMYVNTHIMCQKRFTTHTKCIHM